MSWVENCFEILPSRKKVRWGLSPNTFSDSIRVFQLYHLLSCFQNLSRAGEALQSMNYRLFLVHVLQSGAWLTCRWNHPQISMDSQTAAATILLCSHVPCVEKGNRCSHHLSPKDSDTFSICCESWRSVLLVLVFSFPFMLHSTSKSTISAESLQGLCLTWGLQASLPLLKYLPHQPRQIKSAFILIYSDSTATPNSLHQWSSVFMCMNTMCEICLNEDSSFFLIQWWWGPRTFIFNW